MIILAAKFCFVLGNSLLQAFRLFLSVRHLNNNTQKIVNRFYLNFVNNQLCIDDDMKFGIQGVFMSIHEL